MFDSTVDLRGRCRISGELSRSCLAGCRSKNKHLHSLALRPLENVFSTDEPVWATNEVKVGLSLLCSDEFPASLASFRGEYAGTSSPHRRLGTLLNARWWIKHRSARPGRCAFFRRQVHVLPRRSLSAGRTQHDDIVSAWPSTTRQG